MKVDRRSLGSLPVSLLVGYAAWALTSLLLSVRLAFVGSLEQAVRWGGFCDALWFAALGLITAGWYELSTRATGRPRTLLRIVTACSLLELAWTPVRSVLGLWSLGHLPAWAAGLLSGAEIVIGGISLVAAVAMLIAAEAWRRERVLTGCFIGLLVLRDVTFYVPAINAALWAHPRVTQLAISAVTLGWSAVVVLVAGLFAQDHPAVEPSALVARRGLGRASSAIWFSILSAFGVGLMFVTSIRSYATMRAVVIGAPLVAVVALIGFAWGLLDAARSRLAGLSSWLLASSAVAVLWYAAILVRHAFSLSRILTRGEDDPSRVYVEVIRSWQIVGPVVGLVGMVLAIHAISRFALARANFALREAATVRGLLFVVLMGSAIALQLQVDKARSESGLLVILLSAVVAAIGALIALAQTCRRGAEAIAADTSLPAARLV